MSGDPLRYCRCTDPPHVENCKDCIGFGLQPCSPEHDGSEFGGVHAGTHKRPRFASDSDNAALFAGVCPTCGTGIASYGTGPGMGK